MGAGRPGWGTLVAKKRPAASKCLRSAAERGVPGATGRGPKTSLKTSPRRMRVYGRAGELVFDKGFVQASALLREALPPQVAEMPTCLLPRLTRATQLACVHLGDTKG